MKRHQTCLAGLLFLVAASLALSGCRSGPPNCGLTDKTEEQCRQELAEKGVFCQGVLDRVDYVTQDRYRSQSEIRTLLRFRDGSSCLTDPSFDPTSVNGVTAGTVVRVIWSRLPVEKHCCFEGNFKCFKDACAYVQTLGTGNTAER